MKKSSFALAAILFYCSHNDNLAKIDCQGIFTLRYYISLLLLPLTENPLGVISSEMKLSDAVRRIFSHDSDNKVRNIIVEKAGTIYADSTKAYK